MEPKVGTAIPKCFYCHENKNELVMNTRLTQSAARNVESMHGMVCDMQPCDTCQGHMDQGVILITINNEKSEKNWQTPPEQYRTSVQAKDARHARETQFWVPNPYRTGGWFVVRDEAIEKMFDENMANWALENRFMFIEEDAARLMGLYDTMHKTQQQGRDDGSGANS